MSVLRPREPKPRALRPPVTRRNRAHPFLDHVDLEVVNWSTQEGEPTINLDDLGYWDDDTGFQMINTAELGLPAGSVADDAEAMALVKMWKLGPLGLPAPTAVSTATIDASIQGVVRRDVLEFYLTQPGATFDPELSSWGADGPLAARLADGRVVLIDGTHRWAAAHLLGEPWFSVQILGT